MADIQFVFQNLELRGKKLLIEYREPFKMIKDTSLAGKCPGMCPCADSFRTFRDFDWSIVNRELIARFPSLNIELLLEN